MGSHLRKCLGNALLEANSQTADNTYTDPYVLWASDSFSSSLMYKVVIRLCDTAAKEPPLQLRGTKNLPHCTALQEHANSGRQTMSRKYMHAPSKANLSVAV